MYSRDGNPSKRFKSSPLNTTDSSLVNGGTSNTVTTSSVNDPVLTSDPNATMMSAAAAAAAAAAQGYNYATQSWTGYTVSIVFVALFNAI